MSLSILGPLSLLTEYARFVSEKHKEASNYF